MGTFAETLRTILNERGMSQAALARQIGVTSQAVSGWFAAGNTPSRENVARIEDELAIEPRGMLMQLAGYANDGTEKPTVESLIRSDPGLHAEDKRVLLRVLLLARERQGLTRQRATTAAEVAELEQVAEANRRRRKGVPLGS